MKTQFLKYKFLGLFFLFISYNSFFGIEAKAQVNFQNLENSSLKKVLKQAQKQDKVVFIDFRADWCIPCVHMEETTFQDANLTKFIAQNFIAFQVDVDFFDGMDIADKYEVSTYPTILILDSEGNLMKRLQGYQMPKPLIEKIKPFVN